MGHTVREVGTDTHVVLSNECTRAARVRDSGHAKIVDDLVMGGKRPANEYAFVLYTEEER
jgi:hypothetical protein